MAWGYHLLVDLSRCNPKSIRCPIHIGKFATKLVKTIDMVAYGPPQLVRFGEKDKEGYTLVQLIETSNITGHFCESTNDAYIDIFSCKPYDEQVALGLIDTYFHPKQVRHTLIERQAITPNLK